MHTIQTETMRTILAGRRIGLLDAHPDDHILHAHALEIAAQLGSDVEEFIATLGRASTNNFRCAEGFSVTAGDRRYEAAAAARPLGIHRVHSYDFTDGALAAEAEQVVPVVADWLTRRDITVLLTLGGLRDHADHRATGIIGARAAALAITDRACPVRVFNVYADGRGELVAEATPGSMERAYAGAGAHGSQFLSSADPQDDWVFVPGGHSMHPDSAASLHQYPLLYDATYREQAMGELLVPAGVQA